MRPSTFLLLQVFLVYQAAHGSWIDTGRAVQKEMSVWLPNCAIILFTCTCFPCGERFLDLEMFSLTWRVQYLRCAFSWSAALLSWFLFLITEPITSVPKNSPHRVSFYMPLHIPAKSMDVLERMLTAVSDPKVSTTLNIIWAHDCTTLCAHINNRVCITGNTFLATKHWPSHLSRVEPKR